LKLFYIGNLATNAWRDKPTIEAIFKRIEGYAKDGAKAIEAALEEKP
jgi:hypothetical protein